VREAFLPQVEIDAGDPLPEIHQGNGDVHGERGLSGSALLVARTTTCADATASCSAAST